MEKGSLFKNMTLVATQQILLPTISMKMSLIISQSKTGLLIPVTSIYLIMQFGTSYKRYSTRSYTDMKTPKVLQQQCRMYGIDGQKNLSIIQSTNGGCD